MTKQETELPHVIGVGHVALSVRNPAALAEFYRDVLSLQVVPTQTSDLGENVFLSSRPAEVSVDLASTECGQVSHKSEGYSSCLTTKEIDA